MNSDSLFHLENIYFSYDEEVVFQDFSMDIRENEIISIKGESGAGKTTLFRLLLGFEFPDEGQISYKGESYSTENIHRLRNEVAWLPQDLNLGAGNTAEMLRFIFEFQANANSNPDRNKIIESLSRLGLDEEILESKFSDLSTGQRQRVGLTTCYLLNKKVLLLDEPTSALDERSKQKVADLLLQDGFTVISTSHDPWWLEKCDRVIEL